MSETKKEMFLRLRDEALVLASICKTNQLKNEAMLLFYKWTLYAREEK